MKYGSFVVFFFTLSIFLLVLLQLERNLLLESISNFKAVAEADPSRHAALYNAALAYLLLGDRLQLSQQKLEAYHASAHSFSTLFQLLPQPSPTMYAWLLQKKKNLFII